MVDDQTDAGGTAEGTHTVVTSDACQQMDTGLLRAGLSDVALDLATAGFSALWHGRTLTPSELHPDNVDQAVKVAQVLVAQGRAEVGDAGRIVGIHGLTLRDTRHSFEAAGQLHNTWCAFDAVGIPAALRLDAVSRTHCPTCGDSVTVEFVVGGDASGDAVLWLPAHPPPT